MKTASEWKSYANNMMPDGEVTTKLIELIQEDAKKIVFNKPEITPNTSGHDSMAIIILCVISDKNGNRRYNFAFCTSNGELIDGKAKNEFWFRDVQTSTLHSKLTEDQTFEGWIELPNLYNIQFK